MARIGWGFIHDLRSVSTAENKLTVQASLIQCSLQVFKRHVSDAAAEDESSRRFSVTTDRPATRPPMRWIHLYIRDLQISLSVKQSEAIETSPEKVKDLALQKVLDFLGLSRPSKMWTIRGTLMAPFGIMARWIVVNVLCRLVTVTIENIQVILLHEKPDIETEVKLSRVRFDATKIVQAIDTPISSSVKNRKMSLDSPDLGWLSKVLISPHQAASEFFARQPSKHRLVFSLSLLNCTVTCRSISLSLMTPVTLIKIEEQVEFVLSWRLSKWAKYFMKPQLDVLASSVTVYADALAEVSQALKKDSDLKQSSVNSEKQLDAALIASFFSCNWKCGVSLSLVKVIYTLTDSQCQVLTSSLNPSISDPFQHRRSTLPSEKAAQIAVSWQQFTFKAGSQQQKRDLSYDVTKTESRNVDPGQLSLSTELKYLRVLILPSDTHATCYKYLDLFAIESLQNDLILPHYLLRSLLPSTEYTVASEMPTRTLTLDLKIKRPTVVIDLPYMKAIKRALTGFSEAKTTPSQKPDLNIALLQDLARRVSIDFAIQVSNLTIAVTTPNHETTDFALLAACGKDAQFTFTWDEQQAPMHRRMSLRETVVSRTQYYSSVQVSVDGLKIISDHGAVRDVCEKVMSCLQEPRPAVEIQRFVLATSCAAPGMALTAILKDDKWIMPGTAVNVLCELFVDTSVSMNGAHILALPSRGVSSTELGIWSKLKSVSKKVSTPTKSIYAFDAFVVNATTRLTITDLTIACAVAGYENRLVGICLETLEASNHAMLCQRGLFFEEKVSMPDANSSLIINAAACHWKDESSISSFQPLLAVSQMSVTQGLALAESAHLWTVAVDVKSVTAEYGLSEHVLCWRAGGFIKSLLPRRDENTRAVESHNTKKLPLKLSLLVHDVTIAMNMPNAVELKLNFANIRSDTDLTQLTSSISLEEIQIITPGDVALMTLSDTSVFVPLDFKKHREKEIQVKIQLLFWFLEYDYDFSALLDSTSNMIKLVKQLNKSGTPKATTPMTSEIDDMRRSQFQKLPLVNVNLVSIEVMFEDDPLDGLLSRNFHVGLKAQRARMRRDTAFQRKVREIHDSAYQNLSAEKQSQAWDLLQLANARIWKSQIGKYEESSQQARRHPSGSLSTAPLFTAELGNVNLSISPPDLLANTIEETIHMLDAATPAQFDYDMLIALQLNARISDVLIRLRDFPTPLMHIPQSVNDVTISGLLIISEYIKDHSISSRKVTLPIILDNKHLEDAVVFRGVAPTKIHTLMKVTMPGSDGDQDFSRVPLHISQFCYGMAIEPHLADMNRRFSRLTPPSVDSSMSLPFWDKLRLLAHGHFHFRIPRQSEFRVRMTGTRHPHLAGNGQGAGLDISLLGGVDTFVGTDPRLKNVEPTQDSIATAPIRIHCAEVQVSVPIANTFSGSYLDEESDVFVRFSGGVQLGISFDFETLGSGSHLDVNMRVSNSSERHDSFAPIRSKAIVVNLSVSASAPEVSSLATGRNFVNMHHVLIAHFTRFSAIYTSRLTVLPIRHGTYFFPPPSSPPPAQKLTRYIRGVNIQLNLANLLLGYTNEGDTCEIGLRARIDQIQLAVFLQQQNFLPGQKGTGWDMIAADFDMTNLQIRATRSKEYTETHLRTSSMDVPVFSLNVSSAESLENSVEDASWRIDCGDEFTPDEEMEPFLWAPRVIYFRHGSDKIFELVDTTIAGTVLPARDVNVMQLQLLQKRMEEIDDEIARDQQTVKQWEERISIYADEVLTRQSQALVEKMATMFERKSVIQKRIDSRMSMINYGRGSRHRHSQHDVLKALRSRKASVSSKHLRKPSIMSFDPREVEKKKEFLHRFVVHNLNVLWNIPVRNLIFQMLDLGQQSHSYAYYMRTAAISMIRELVDASSNMQSSQKSSKESVQMDEAAASMSHQVATELLQKLVAERGDNIVVVTEDDDTMNEGVSRLDPNNPTYISPEYKLRNDYQLQLFYPQFSLETVGVNCAPGYVLITAESANLKTSSIIDEGEGLHAEVQKVKDRHVAGISNAQFFTVFRKDVTNKSSSWGAADGPDDVQWPIWVPMEYIFDESVATEEFGRMVSRANVQVQYDACSPIYLPSGQTLKVDSLYAKVPGLYTEPADQLEHVNSVFVKFPRIVVAATSAQYCAIADIGSNVLNYKDPVKKQRTEQANTMLFALMKEDLRGVVNVVQHMQHRLRRLENMSKLVFKRLVAMDSDVQESEKMQRTNARHMQIVRKKNSAAQELILVMDALRRIASQRQNKNSVKKSLRLVVDSSQLTWRMMLDKSDELCQLSLLGCKYNSINFEDQSNSNTLEVRKILLDNCLPNQMYVELVAPYLPNAIDQSNLERQQMLRVYWRELAPVAGIAIVDHFEVNIHPLLFQLTHQVAKGLIEYIYPKTKKQSKSSKKKSEDTREFPINVESRSSDLKVPSNDSTSVAEAQSISSPFSMFSRTRKSSHNEDITLSQSSSEESLNDTPTQTIDGKSTSSSRTSPRMRHRHRLFGHAFNADGDDVLQSLNLGEDSDVQLMKDRASSNKTFVYIKIPGSTHCLSYHGEKEKNIEDLYQFVLKLPTLEYHNSTWTFLEFLMQVRKDIVVAVFSQTGSFIREKLSRKRRHPPKQLRPAAITEVDNTNTEDESKPKSSKSKVKFSKDLVTPPSPHVDQPLSSVESLKAILSNTSTMSSSSSLESFASDDSPDPSPRVSPPLLQKSKNSQNFSHK